MFLYIIAAYKRLCNCRLEGIFPSLEASHALAFVDKLCPTLPSGSKVVVYCSSNGHKDASTVLKTMNKIQYVTVNECSFLISDCIIISVQYDKKIRTSLGLRLRSAIYCTLNCNTDHWAKLD